jgi:rhodanese-related sulfurtransferase
MSIQIPSISPAELHALQRQHKGIEVIDVRTPGEYRSGHIKGARLLPLDELRPEKLPLVHSDGESRDSEQNVYITCQSGYRAAQAAERLAIAGYRAVKVVEGGTQAWEKAGLPIKRCGSVISIERQVQITVGSLIVLKVFFGFTVHELFFALAALIGSGLIVAGITRWCGMAQLIAGMPWNRGGGCIESAAVKPDLVGLNRRAT